MKSPWHTSIEKVFIHRDSLQSEVAQRAELFFNPEIIEIVDSQPLSHLNGELSAEDFNRSKKLLYICEFKGEFFKRCPGSRPGLTCCNYFVLNLGQQCNMNCSYCYLQSFINNPVMTIYSNINKALEELKVIAEKNRDVSFRVGTGEVIDSLSMDDFTLYSKKLIEFFNHYPKWNLEFKTKSDQVEQFINTPHEGNTIVSWSINPQNIVETEEHGTASLDKRLQAARKCKDKGFQVAFHIDPLIWHPGWQESYKTLVDSVTFYFDPEEVNVMSVGALRFQPSQRHMMKTRFGFKSWVNQAEVHKSKDGKLRYDQSLRQEMLKLVIEDFKSRDSAWKIFLCMETPETWLSTMESMPKSIKGLEPLFDHSIIKKASKSCSSTC